MAEVNTPFLPGDFAATDNLVATAAGTNGVTLTNADLRRGFAFGDSITELKIDTAPFLHILNKFRKKPVAETIFKTTQSRSQLHRRYGYVVGWRLWDGTSDISSTTGDYTTNSSTLTTLTPETVGSYGCFKIGTDYKTSGVITNSYGQSSGAISIGDAGTTPNFILVNDLMKINTNSASTAVYAMADFFVVKVLQVKTSGYYAYIGYVVVRALKTSTNCYLTSFPNSATTAISATYSYRTGFSEASKASLEDMRAYVVGNSQKQGSGYPGTWNSQPFSTAYTMTDITKTTLMVAGSTLATEYKLAANERARLWGEKLLEHKLDRAQKVYWSSLYTESDGTQHTQGIVDYVLSNCPTFSMTYSSYTKDSLLEDMSTYLDPRFNNIANHLYLVPTMTWNWLHKLGGFALNNLKLGYQSYGAHFTFDFSGSKSLAGAEVSQFGTQYGTMNVLRDVNLDNSGVKMIGVNLDYVMLRPLSGNGYNRDTTLYPGVKSIQNSGEDVLVDLIQTEEAVEITMPETHCVWT
jgi:hypothetical protein